MLQPYLTIAPSEKGGRGVHTIKSIPKGTVIEISPVIPLIKKDRKVIETTKLHDYIFEWGTTKLQACLALGYVSMYNHSFDPNCEYEMDYEAHTMTVTTIKAIKKGDELFFSYNGDPKDQTSLWFKTK